MNKRNAKAQATRQLDLGGLDSALGFRLRMLEQAVMRSFGRHMDPLEISPTLYSILILVEANPGCRQIELSQALGMHQPNLVERVGLLMERGLVTRREDARDRRANVLELTFAGRHFMQKLREAHDGHVAEVRAMLGEARYQSLMGLIDPAAA